MSWRFRRYVPVHARRANAKREITKVLKKGELPQPIAAFGGRTIATTFWGEAWCENLESYSDYANRLPRGRTYTRNGSIVHLSIEQGLITAFVSGSELYKVSVKIEALDQARWQSFIQRCSGQIDTLLDLFQGKVSSAVLQEITDRQHGLFPSPTEITLKCSCPDWATMCKHVAATLYGVGVRLDDTPELFFTLRGVDHLEILESVNSSSLEDSLPSHEDILTDSDLGAIFGIEFSDLPDLASTTGRPNKLRASRRRRRD